MADPKIAAKNPVGMDLEPGTYWWCSCGESQNQPWCDGSHKGSEFSPQKLEIEEAKKVWLCQCKRAETAPFCDGTHKGL
jgi:CDGSH iron-sulfur domain-containing protein 3